MPRPTDWNAIGLSGDPTPGEPEQITQLAGTFSELGGTARRIWDAIQQVMSTTNGAFVGEAADALRSKVDQRLAGHVEDVAWAFETSAQALNEWAATVTEQQQKADAALAAGRGLAEDDPQREQLASTAREAGETQAAQGRSVAGRIESVSHIQLPISACEVFWEAFQWLAIILIIPALVLGGPIALLALGVNLTLFIKTVVDVVRGDASFLDLFLAGLGLIAPTTKGLPIFKIIKSAASAVGKGLRGLGTAALQIMRNLFTGGTLSFAHLLPNLRDVLVLTTSWVRQGGLWVMAGIRDLPSIAAGAFQRGGLVVVGGLKAIPGLLHTVPLAIGKGVSFVWRAGVTGVETAFNFARAELGNGKWLRLLLPVDAGEIGQFGLARALRIGFVERGVFGKFRYGAPLAGAVGHTISAAPIRPPEVNGLVHMSRIELAQVRLGDWAGQWAGLKPFEMTQGPLHATLQPPAPQFGQLGQLGVGVADRASLGFHASRQLDALLDLPVHQLGAVRTGSWAGTPVQLEGNLGVSAVATPSFAHASSGLYLPASAGAPAVAGHGITGLTGTPMPSAAHTAVAGVQAPSISGTGTVDLLTSVRPGSTPAPAPAVLATSVTAVTTPPGVTLSSHVPVGALPGSVVGVEHTALTVGAPQPSTAGTADLLAPLSHTGTPTTAHTVLQSGPNFQPVTSGGVSALDLVAGGRARPDIPTTGAGALFTDHTTNLLTAHQIRTHLSELVQTPGVPHPAGPGSADRMGATASLGDYGHGVRTPVSGGDRSLSGAPDNQALAGVPGTQGLGSGTHGTAGAPASGAAGQPSTGPAAVDASVLKGKGRADAPAVTNSPVEGGNPARNITADPRTVLPDAVEVPAGTGNLATPPPVTRAPAETGGSTAPGPHHGAVNPDRTPAGAGQARGMGPQSRDLTLQQIQRLADRDAERFDALFGAADDPLHDLRRGAWLEFSDARQAVGRADRQLDHDAARHGSGSSSNPTPHQIHLQNAADAARQHYGDAYRKLTDLGIDPALLDRDLTALYARSLVERPRTVAGMPASDVATPPVSQRIQLSGFDGEPTGQAILMDVTGPDGTLGTPRLEGGTDTHGIQRDNGVFRLTRPNGRGSSDFDLNGRLIMDRRPLQGGDESPFLGMAVEFRTGNGGALTHTLDPAGGQRLDVLPNGDLRVSEPNGGRTSVFHGDGSHVEDGIRLRGPAGLFGNGDRIITTGPGGHAVTDMQGALVPGVAPDALGGSGFRLTDTQSGSSVRFTSMGVEVERGVALVDPVQGTRYSVADGSGGFQLTDVRGTRVSGVEVQAVDNSGFRVTETSGSSVLFDARGVHVERGVALVDPVQGTRYSVADGSGQVHLTDVHGTGLPDRVFAVPGNSGFRVADGTGYRSYAPDGSFHGHGVQLTGGTATGHLDFHSNGTFRQRLDDPFASNQSVPVQAVGNEYTIDLPQAGPFQRQEVFDNHGALLRVRDEVKLRQSPRLGEFTEFDAHGNRIRQGFNVLDDGSRTDFQYVIDFPTGPGSATWRRTGGGPTVLHDGAFHHGPAKAYGPGDGWIRLDSSTGGKGVPVFERRLLPGGDTLDSFRRTDTVAFGHFNRRTTWVQWDAAGDLRGWGKRHFDTAGTGWSDVTHSSMGNHRAMTTIREYRDGLQKYAEGKTGHVLAVKGDNGSWTWNRYDGAGKHLADGPRTRDLGGGWTDRVTGSNTVVQRQWGEWRHPDNARHYGEFKLVEPSAPAQGSWVPSPLWERQSPHGKESGKIEKLTTGVQLTTERIGEQRPPVWMRNDPALQPSHAHLGGDSGFQMFTWSTADANTGLRYVAMDGSTVDINANGRFVRSKTKLHSGNELWVGDYVSTGTGGSLKWEEVHNGANPVRKGVRELNLPPGQDTLWKDLVDTPGLLEGQWPVAREGLRDGTVREYLTPRLPGEEMGRGSWVTRDAHGNLTGIQHPSRSPDTDGGAGQYIHATGRQDSDSWTWKLVNSQGKDATTTGTGPLTGKREFFRGSHDPALSWDDSFRDFGADGSLIRERRMLDKGSYVDAWDNGGTAWSSAKYGKDDVQIPNSGIQKRQWLQGDGNWGDAWTPGADHWRDVAPAGTPNPGRVLRSAGTHDIQVGSNTPLRDHTVSGVGSLRVREYDAQTDGVWKEFDHGSVVRQRSDVAGGGFLETDAWRGQWRRYDSHNQLIAQRTDSGLVFEMRGNSLQLTGNEYDFRGPLTEIRGWGRRVREAQRMPWSSNPLSIGESVYTPYWKTVAGKVALEFGQELILEFGANLAVNGIAAAVQHKPFTGKDALKSFANAAVSAGIKGGVGTMIHENSVRGFLTLGAGRAGVANIDSGKHWSRRPFNHEKTWGNEWGGNETATRWRGGSYDFGFGVGTSVLAGWVNGSMNAAVWGITDANGNTVKLHGVDALGDGGINALASLTTSVSTGLVKNLALLTAGGRLFHRQGFADFWLQLPFKIFEKSIQGTFLTSAYREGINPGWFQVPPPAPVSLAAFTLGPAFGSGPGVPGAAPASSQQNQRGTST